MWTLRKWTKFSSGTSPKAIAESKPSAATAKKNLNPCQVKRFFTATRQTSEGSKNSKGLLGPLQEAEDQLHGNSWNKTEPEDGAACQQLS